MTEVWLRGPIPDVPDELQPVAHALLQIGEEMDRLVAGLDAARIASRPGRSASIEYHARHLAGSLDRLLTYARGEGLTDTQRDLLQTEGTPSGVDGAALTAVVHRAIQQAITQLRATLPASLNDARKVGRAGLPSNVRGLLVHAAEHSARHAGQIATLVRVLNTDEAPAR